MNTSVTRDGKIIFEGKTYATSPESIKYINDIDNAALNRTRELVKQKKTHQPFFNSPEFIECADS
jgi:hypothetical protein